MRVVVLGLWHLGSVTAACLAKHHQVIGLDFDDAVVAGLRSGRAPLHEPGLDELLSAGLASGKLSFATDPAVAAQAEVAWVCYDTPVDADDRSDLAWVRSRLDRVPPVLPPGTVVLLSSQLPAGTCAGLAAAHPPLHFACSPENLRLGKAIEAFEKPARIVVGVSAGEARARLQELFAPLAVPLLWMRTESAEMVKHALNSFLALSIAYINEIATVCEVVGADAQEVTAGLKSEPRIGPRAYLGPGGPFAGGTLARDVVILTELGQAAKLSLALVPAIKQSNDRHRGWAFRKLQTALAGIKNPAVAVLGLTYTIDTRTLRRSAAGIGVRAFDPLVRTTDAEHRDLHLSPSAAAAMAGAHAIVVCTEWLALLASVALPLVVDPNRLVEKCVLPFPKIIYLTVGSP